MRAIGGTPAKKEPRNTAVARLKGKKRPWRTKGPTFPVRVVRAKEKS